jgi:hypothetical protein
LKAKRNFILKGNKMKTTFLKLAVAATLVTAGAPAFADLIYAPGNLQRGAGLGNVSTVVTVQDNGNGPQQNGTESGCVVYSGNNSNPNFSPCRTGVEGGDNTAGQPGVAGNNTYLLSDIDGLVSAGQLGLVVNVDEPGNDGVVTLTTLYLSLFNLNNSQTQFHSYTGSLVLDQASGVGQSGFHRFVLDAAQAAQANTFCPTLSSCILGGGVQFAAGSTSGGFETVSVAAFERDDNGTGDPGGNPIPEPGSIVLLGAGALAITSLRRRRAVKN